MDQKYLDFIVDLKKKIIQSRYIAARLANKEQLMLYFQTGKMLSEKIELEKWGAKIVEQISDDLQTQLPGLKGFSRRNLMNMRRFFNEYQRLTFVQTLSAQFKENSNTNEVSPHQDYFFSISFSHHLHVLNKCTTTDERLFYIEQATDLYKHQGKLPNNFEKTLPTLKPSALQVFRDEYLMDFICSSDTEDERVLEEKVVADIKNFILRMGSGFCFLGNQYRLEVAMTQ